MCIKDHERLNEKHMASILFFGNKTLTVDAPDLGTLFNFKAQLKICRD